MLKAIIEVITSQRDTNGNCHHLARFYSVERGRNECFMVEAGGASNPSCIGYNLFGDYESFLVIAKTVTKSDWKYEHKHALFVAYESEETMANLREFFNLNPKV